jgi:DNA repair protein RadA/Sms
MPRPRTAWRCQQCGYAAPKWLGRCPDCGEFATFVEEIPSQTAARAAAEAPAGVVTPLADVDLDASQRTPTGVGEFDRALGGGLVRGSVVLIAGEPGIGKSTLLVQVAGALGAGGGRVLYVCGEESPQQVKSRAARVGVEAGVSLLSETDAAVVVATALRERPDLLVVDSIQTLADPDLDGVPGSVGQVRSSAALLVRLAKAHGITIVIVGHVTKEGTIAGPRVLEHVVDTVLSFEGDRDHVLRIVRATKNRFGSISEVGIFEMTSAGLAGVDQPSGALLAERSAGAPGSAIMATVEGTRPMLVEVQALATPSYLQTPRRLAVGVDTPRVLQVLAVLERRGGIDLGKHDVYVSVAGGVRISEPAVDLPLALALSSAARDSALAPELCVFGELGLTGEVRSVRQVEPRLREAARMGFSDVIGPPGAGGNVGVREARTLREALDAAGVTGGRPE